MGASADLERPIIFMIFLSGVTLGDIEIFVNDSVSMRCSPRRSIDIQWHHNSYINYVYAGRLLRPPYNRRFLITKYETTGDYDLIIPNVTLEDAGWYYCSEELSGRRINSTQLTVLYMKPVCSSNMPTDGFIGPNTCNIQQENMTFICDVVFNGRPPHLSWRSANDSQVFNSSSCEVKSNRRSCSLTLKADPSYDGLVFRCDVGKIKLDDRRYSCNTERIKVHYFFGDYAYEDKYVHETGSCVVRSNLNVRYNWTLKQDNEEIFLTSKQTVSIEQSGLHQCEVKYSIINVTCSTLVSVVSATVFIARTETPKEQSNTLLAVTLPIALFVSVIALIGSTIYILKLKRQVNLNKSSSEVEMPLIVSSCDYLHEKNSWIPKISISDLPLELIDIMLGKSYLRAILRQKESSHNRKDEMVIKLLASVDFRWFQRISRKRFKNFVLSKLKKYYEERYRPYFIFKNNQQFFEEIHPVNEKTNMILSTDYLSKSEVAKWERKRSSKKRQTENQMLRTAFLGPENKDSAFEDFHSSCDPEDQEVIKEIMNSGGDSARVEIKMSRPLTEFRLIPQYFEDNEMKILTSLPDRHAVVWIWCHCTEAQQKLNNRDGLKKLIEIVRQSEKATADVLEHRTNIDYDQLEKKIVAIPLIFLDFKTTLNFRREKTLSENKSSDSDIDKVIDVTKLKMKIYVLCAICSNRAGNSSEYASPMICVFEAHSPYPIVEVISLKRFDSSEFTSIVSSVKENCLYVLTSSKIENHWVDEVIRVEIKENGANSPQHPSKWLELEEGYRPHTLSISKDGDLMMFNTFSPIILRIYYPDARLRLSVELHEDIRKTFKAVETSNGNFIVMHTMKRQTEYAEKGTNEEVETVSEVSRDGKTIIRRFIPQNQQQQLFDGRDLCIDSRDRVFVVDKNNHRVFVLDSCLRWIGNLIPQDKNRDEMKKLLPPSKLFYDEVSHEVIIAEEDEVHIYYLVQCFPTCVPRHTNVPSGVPRLYAARGGRTICRPEKEVGFK